MWISFCGRKLFCECPAEAACGRPTSVLLCPGRGQCATGLNSGLLSLLFVWLGRDPSVMVRLRPKILPYMLYVIKSPQSIMFTACGITLRAVNVARLFVSYVLLPLPLAFLRLFFSWLLGLGRTITLGPRPNQTNNKDNRPELSPVAHWPRPGHSKTDVDGRRPLPQDIRGIAYARGRKSTSAITITADPCPTRVPLRPLQLKSSQSLWQYNFTYINELLCWNVASPRWSAVIMDSTPQASLVGRSLPAIPPLHRLAVVILSLSPGVDSCFRLYHHPAFIADPVFDIQYKLK
ncbi:hypothetical protein Tco_0065125 [Tanacetum coccineum]